MIDLVPDALMDAAAWPVWLRQFLAVAWLIGKVVCATLLWLLVLAACILPFMGRSEEDTPDSETLWRLGREDRPDFVQQPLVQRPDADARDIRRAVLRYDATGTFPPLHEN